MGKIIALCAALACAGMCGCASRGSSGTDGLVLEGRAGRVVLDVHGGRMLSWRLPSGEEMLFMPEQRESPDGDWSHGGISICWPWFGKKGDAASSIHGFARNRELTVRGSRIAADGASAVLGLSLAKGEVPDFPYAADMELTVKVSDRLTMTLRTVNTGKEAFSFSNGFQPYFAVSGYRAVTLRGVKTQDFAAVDGMDAAFPRLGDGFALADAGTGREIRAKARGNTGIVVWSPGNVEPHNRNLAAGDTERFIGMGPSNRVKEGPITLAPGQSHELLFELDCRRIRD